jgi:hypothetical protein
MQLCIMSRKDDLRTLIGRCFSRPNTLFQPDNLDELARLIDTDMPTREVPQRDETLAIALLRPKVAALSFDRVWAGAHPDVPKHLSFFGDSQIEVRLVAANLLSNVVENQMSKGSPVFSHSDLMNLNREILFGAFQYQDDAAAKSFIQGNPEGLSRVVASAFQQQYGMRPIPVYATQESRDLAYRQGSTEALVSILSNLGVVDEQRTTWEQIREFRRDKQATAKYRALVHWLDDTMIGKPISFIEDEINRRIDDYQWSIKKYGMETVVGTLAAIADSKSLFGAAATYVTLATLGNDLVAAVAGVGILVAKASTHVARAALNLEDIKRTKNPEVAYVHQALKQLGRNG